MYKLHVTYEACQWRDMFDCNCSVLLHVDVFSLYRTGRRGNNYVFVITPSLSSRHTDDGGLRNLSKDLCIVCVER